MHAGRRAAGGLSAGALAAIDVVYAARRRISPVYLLDALPEVLPRGLVGAAGRVRRARVARVTLPDRTSPEGLQRERTSRNVCAVARPWYGVIGLVAVGRR